MLSIGRMAYQIPAIVIDGDSAIANAIEAMLPRTYVLEDYRHWKDNALQAIGGPEPHRLFARHLQPLVDARTFEQFDALEAQMLPDMPDRLRNYLTSNEGAAGRSPLQRLRSTLV